MSLNRSSRECKTAKHFFCTRQGRWRLDHLALVKSVFHTWMTRSWALHFSVWMSLLVRWISNTGTFVLLANGVEQQRQTAHSQGLRGRTGQMKIFVPWRFYSGEHRTFVQHGITKLKLCWTYKIIREHWYIILDAIKNLFLTWDVPNLKATLTPYCTPTKKDDRSRSRPSECKWAQRETRIATRFVRPTLTASRASSDLRESSNLHRSLQSRYENHRILCNECAGSLKNYKP